jgi:hypothetical protein
MRRLHDRTGREEGTPWTRREGNGVEVQVRIRTILAVTVLVAGAPTAVSRDYVIDPFDEMGWIGMSDAIARVRFDAPRSSASNEEPLTQHTATVLGIFKRDDRLPLPPGRVEIIERRGFMQTEDGDYPCWDNSQPLPTDTEAIAFLRWDADRQAFLLGTVADVQSGARRLRMRRSIRLCDPEQPAD